ncbi:MAG: hypothetical protein ACI8P0_004323 [Planctomycetaceae bacterium]|jgi:hypothetical protein
MTVAARRDEPATEGSDLLRLRRTGCKQPVPPGSESEKENCQEPRPAICRLFRSREYKIGPTGQPFDSPGRSPGYGVS